MKSIVMVVGFPTANVTPAGNVPKVTTTPWPSSTRSSSWAQTPSPVRVSFSQNLATPGPVKIYAAACAAERRGHQRYLELAAGIHDGSSVLGGALR